VQADGTTAPISSAQVEIGIHKFCMRMPLCGHFLATKNSTAPGDTETVPCRRTAWGKRDAQADYTEAVV